MINVIGHLVEHFFTTRTRPASLSSKCLHQGLHKLLIKKEEFF
jgi:hypothetical protein